MSNIKSLAKTLPALGALSLVVALAPVGLDIAGVSISANTAWAQGKSEGKGGDRGNSGSESHGGGSENAGGGGSGGGNAGDRDSGHAADRSNDHAKNENGALASALGALNAAHASASAFDNAADGSRVGLIRVYRDAVLATNQLVADYDTLKENADKAQADADAALADDNAAEDAQDKADLTDAAALLGLWNDAQTALAADPEDDDLIDAEAAAKANWEQADDDDDAAAVAQALADATDAVALQDAADTASSDLSDAYDALETAGDDETAALKAAANKTVTDAVTTEVNRLLGIENAELPDDPTP